MVCVWESLKREHNILPLAGDSEMHLFSLQQGSSPYCRQALRKPPRTVLAVCCLNHAAHITFKSWVSFELNANQGGIFDKGQVFEKLRAKLSENHFVRDLRTEV